ncbi:mannitol dehydrogenase family protein [Paramicrobacterium chengjingii]|uniref:Mannitol-1-phosphate 5-dehydrogenase n=1 Tax=Paramicrobacterium chengjingii TaxID=2769067 RepID=A0ABX6YHD0_9MICO|nr:mannitol dehydrogenase family protein [Microbacterium chengjingii]QPZ38197.1 mannitol dehydrogenase family protein [Microbacterium chengjingii]
MTTTLSSATLDALDPRIAVPQYDRATVSVGVVHLGVGGFHRAHQAVVMDDLLASGQSEWGICGVGLLDGDVRMRDALRTQDTLYTHVTRAADGRTDVRVIGSIVEYLFAPEERELVLRRLTDPATRVVSLTVTEGGYLQSHATGRFDPEAAAVVADLASPEVPSGAFGYIVEALRLRRDRGIRPFTVMSCDNIRANGDVARSAALGYASLRSPDLAEWIADNVSFPNSMVDRITPATSTEVHEVLRSEYGLDDAWPVASEDYFQWVLEDDFCNARPPYEDARVEVVRDVVPFELMKLRMLNASHQILAYLGSVAGYRLVHEAAADEALRHVLRHFWLNEAIPTLTPIPGVNFVDYAESLLSRYANPHVRDTLERLATDASNRIPVFVLPIVADCLTGGLPPTVGALTVATWEKYVRGIDDNGDELIQHDNRADALRKRAVAGSTGVHGFLGDPAVFGDLGNDATFVAQYEQCRTVLESNTVTNAVRVVLGPVSVR